MKERKNESGRQLWTMTKGPIKHCIAPESFGGAELLRIGKIGILWPLAETSLSGIQAAGSYLSPHHVSRHGA
jgi:hypothetical protein